MHIPPEYKNFHEVNVSMRWGRLLCFIMYERFMCFSNEIINGEHWDV